MQTKKTDLVPSTGTGTGTNPSTRKKDSINDLNLQEFMGKLGYQFNDLNLLKKALTHRSYIHEPGQSELKDNERLEFLGDAVLDLIVSDMLWNYFPAEKEGPLSHRRAALVSENSLVDIGNDLGVSHFIMLGKGEKQSGGDKKPRLIASSLEAIIGAIYIDGRYENAFRVVSQFYVNKIKDQGNEENYRKDFKTRLQELIQKELLLTPTYAVQGETGPPHNRRFQVSVMYGEKLMAYGEGSSKKQAEQNAAEKAYQEFLTGLNKKDNI